MPILQNRFNLNILEPLNGAISEPIDEVFSISKWFEGSYQEKKEKFINETFGYRNLLIRINNQIDFSFFKKANAEGVIVGKSNYLFEENYIKAYYGRDFIGVDSSINRVKRLAFIQNKLKQMNKTLLVVFAAGKGSFYPEYFPEYLKSSKNITNYEVHAKLAKQFQINYIDFNDYFIKNKNTSKYPLYPQFGIHWSLYGTATVADSIIKTIENLRNIDMCNLHWDKVDLKQPEGDDRDIAKGTNLLFELKSFNMAYPHLYFDSDSLKTKPSALVVSDSFYWGMFNFGFSNAFSQNHFWYYNTQIYPDSYEKPLETKNVDLLNEINKHDVIVIMATEATLPNFGWGFIENAYKCLLKK